MSESREKLIAKLNKSLPILIDSFVHYSICMMDSEGHILTANPGALRHTGYSTEEIIGSHYRCLFLPEDIASGTPEKLLADAIAKRRASEEAWRVRKDGSRYWADVALNALHDESKKLIGFISLIRDMTEVQRQRDAYHASEQRFRAMMDFSPVGMAIVGIDGKILQVNRAVCDLLGYGAEELTQLTYVDITHLDDIDADLQHVEDLLLRKASSYDMEKRYIRKDGSAIWGLLAVSLVCDADDRPEYFIAQIQDIDDLKRIEAELHEQRDRLDVTLNSIGDGVIATDIAGRIEFMNPVAESLTGYTLDYARGLPHEEIFHIVETESGERMASPVLTCLANHRTVHLAPDATLIRRDGERRDIQDSAAPIRSKAGTTIGSVLVFQDVTHIQYMRKELEFNAMHDALTGLPNRRKYEFMLEDALVEARARVLEHTLCFLDLDQFKIINDSAGHAAGDTLLRMVSRKLLQSVRSNDLVARLGGDEFAIILFNCPKDKTNKIISNLIDAIPTVQLAWEGRVYNVTASIGVTRITAASASISTIMKEADVACYAAKHAGRNRVSVYERDIQKVGKQHNQLILAAEIRNILKEDRLTLFLQKIISTEAANERRYEVLLRTLDHRGEPGPPGLFIHAAETYGMMGEVDRWVFRQILAERTYELSVFPDIRLSLNLSADSLNDPRFLPFFLELMENSLLSPSALTIEITETSLINNLATASAIIEKMRSIGCSIALDDFGIGLSSFGYIRTFPVDFLKIDGSFICDMMRNPIDRAIVKSINTIAHEIGAQTIAESVENSDTLESVRAIGIDYAQGFGIHLPTSISDVTSNILNEH